MARKALEPGMVIELQRQGQEGFEAFTIRKVIGKGGICIAYEVECPNGMIGRLKEFYPAQATGKGYMFSREGKMLFYNPEYGCREMVPVLRRRFLNGYEVMKDLHVRMQEARNEMPNYGELYGGGDSLYWFMSYDEGKCYDEIKEETLSQICAVALATARAVEKYHKIGYLHLDIKPENIFVLSQTKDYIKLIDFDNVVRKEELGDESILIGCSKETSALEVRADKRSRISEASDYYSIGAMVFGRIFKRGIHFNESKYAARYDFGGLLEEYGDKKKELENELSSFFKHTICDFMKGRYASMEELKAQLEKIIKIARPVEEKIETAKILKRALCLMKKYPPYQYASADKKISVLIVGEGERASQLFRLIYGCCGQVLDYGLRIYWACISPEKRKKAMISRCPALPKMTVLDGSNETGKYGLVEQPFAEVFFIRTPEEAKGAKYCLLADDNSDRNRMYADRISRRLKEEGAGEVFIGCLDDEFAAEDEEIYKNLTKTAFQINRIYDKMLDERCPSDYERFCRNLYNYQSSLESAMHIECKLASCGIFEEDSEKAAAAFYEKVLKPKEDLTLYSRLAHLEHRRWMACSVMRGWDMYDADEMDKVTLHNDGSFKDAARKLHPCMTECLDQISLKLHSRAKELCGLSRKIIRERFGEIESSYEDWDQKLPETWERFKDTMIKLDQNTDNVMLIWKDQFQRTKEEVEEGHNGHALRLMEEIKEAAAAYQEYYSNRDYKEMDRLIIDYLPYLLIHGSVSRTIIKGWSQQPGDNIIYAMYMEPEQVVYVSEYDIHKEIENIRAFMKMRKIHTKVSCAVIRNAAEYRLLAHSLGDGASADITGTSAYLASIISRHAYEEDMPLHMYRDGRFQNIYLCPQAEYYAGERTLSVNEAYCLYGIRETAIGASRTTMPQKEVEHLWKCYQEFDTQEEWRQFAGFLKDMSFEEKMLLCGRKAEAAAYWDEYLLEGFLMKTGLHQMISRLNESGLIAEYKRDETDLGEDVHIQIASFYPAILEEVKTLYAQTEACAGRIRIEMKEAKDGNYRIILTRLDVRGNLPAGPMGEAAKRGLERLASYGLVKKLELETGVGFFYTSFGVCRSLIEEDGVLRAYIYDSIRRAGRFQDVKSSTRLEWNTDMEENEWIAEQVDIVAVSGIHPLFIMARTEEPSEESLYMIQYLASRFGIEAKAALVCSNEKAVCERDGRIAARAKTMGVRYINREELRKRNLGDILEEWVGQDGQRETI